MGGSLLGRSSITRALPYDWAEANNVPNACGPKLRAGMGQAECGHAHSRFLYEKSHVDLLLLLVLGARALQ